MFTESGQFNLFEDRMRSNQAFIKIAQFSFCSSSKFSVRAYCLEFRVCSLTIVTAEITSLLRIAWISWLCSHTDWLIR